MDIVSEIEEQQPTIISGEEQPTIISEEEQPTIISGEEQQPQLTALRSIKEQPQLADIAENQPLTLQQLTDILAKK